MDVSARVVVNRGHQFLVSQTARVSSGGLSLVVNETLPIGALVDIEFAIVDELHPYRGEARVRSCEPGPGAGESRLDLEFTRVTHKSLSFREALVDWNRKRRVVAQLAVDAAKYVRHQAKGNKLDDKDFGLRGAGHRRPVLLIHGFLGTRGAMFLTEQHLKSKGFPVFSITLGWLNVHDINRSAQLISERVETIRRRFALDKINILGHSMGGLIGLQYITRFGGADHVRKLVTIGTPFGGARLATAAMIAMPWFGLVAPSTRQMQPQSPFLNELTAPPLPEGVRIVCLAAMHDAVVHPRACVLDGARNIMIATNHAGLVVSPRLFAIVERELGGALDHAERRKVDLAIVRDAADQGAAVDPAI
ncbi:MAG: alpha/beta fold hydrolase [Deltaproteobacteria bacterium]|nr:alpha/beta fold hydrolase [Deltaproteobacteria bacterium]